MANESSSGMGVTGVLFLIFLTLKLAEIGEVASWSWWWVTSPLWLPIVVVVPIFGVVVIIAYIATWWQTRRNLREFEDRNT